MVNIMVIIPPWGVGVLSPTPALSFSIHHGIKCSVCGGTAGIIDGLDIPFICRFMCGIICRNIFFHGAIVDGVSAGLMNQFIGCRTSGGEGLPDRRISGLCGFESGVKLFIRHCVIPPCRLVEWFERLHCLS